MGRPGSRTVAGGVVRGGAARKLPLPNRKIHVMIKTYPLWQRGLAGASIVFAASVVGLIAAAPKAKPVQPAPAQVAQIDMKPAAGNLWPPGGHLYFGRYDQIYRGQVIEFVDTPQGQAVVLRKGITTEILLRKDIAIRDFWIRRD